MNPLVFSLYDYSGKPAIFQLYLLDISITIFYYCSFFNNYPFIAGLLQKKKSVGMLLMYISSPLTRKINSL